MGKTEFRLTVEKDLLTGLGARVRPLLAKVVRRTARDIEARAKTAIKSGPKSGRIYDRNEHQVNFTTRGGKAVSFTAYRGKKRRKPHQASAPGEAPATDEGLLVNSIQTVATGELSAEVTVGAEYGAALEFGSPDGRIAPRPYIGPAVVAAQPEFEQGVTAAIQRASA